MQEVTATEINYGFNVTYLCDECKADIDSNYIWFHNIVIIDNFIVDKIKCPKCFTYVKVLFTNIDKPYNKPGFILEDGWTITCGIGCMEIDKDFIVS